MSKTLYLEKRQRVETAGELSRRATRIKEEFEKAGIDHKIAYFDQLKLLYLANGEVSIQIEAEDLLSGYSQIIFGGHSGFQQYELKQLITRIVQSHRDKGVDVKIQNEHLLSLLPSYSKLTMTQLMIENQLPVLNTLFDGSGQYDRLLTAENQIGSPFILKIISGENDMIMENGKAVVRKNIFLVKSKEDLNQERLISKDLSSFIAQKFSDSGADYRFYLTKDGVVGGMKRVAGEGEFMTVSRGKGAKYTVCNTPPDQIKPLCERFIERLKPDFVAVDILYYDGNPYFLEFSLNPGFYAYETKAEGEPANIADAIISAI